MRQMQSNQNEYSHSAVFPAHSFIESWRARSLICYVCVWQRHGSRWWLAVYLSLRAQPEPRPYPSTGPGTGWCSTWTEETTPQHKDPSKVVVFCFSWGFFRYVFGSWCCWSGSILKLSQVSWDVTWLDLILDIPCITTHTLTEHLLFRFLWCVYLNLQFTCVSTVCVPPICLWGEW